MFDNDEDYSEIEIPLSGPGVYETDMMDNLTDEERELIKQHGALMRRIRSDQRAKYQDQEQQRLKDRMTKIVHRMKTLFSDPEFRAMVKELFADAKALKDEA